jgi:predicted ATPase
MSFDFKKVNIFIGDQGTGKSTVAKILVSIQNTFFRELFNLELQDDKSKETQLFTEYLKIVEIHNFVHVDTEINYNHPVFSFEYKNSKVAIVEKIKLSLNENMR